jgi:hypothetical protein
MSSLDGGGGAPSVYSFRRRASSFSIFDTSRRPSELVWLGPNSHLDVIPGWRPSASAHSSPFAFPTTPQPYEIDGDDDSALLGGTIRADGRGEYLFLRDPWSGGGVRPPPLPPAEEIEAALLRERRGTRASSLPSSVSSVDMRFAAASATLTGRRAVATRGLRVSIDVGAGGHDYGSE